MADSIVDSVVEALKLNLTANATGEEAASSPVPRPPATPEGIAIAYGSIVVMAVLPIFFGAYRSVRHQKQQKVDGVRVWKFEAFDPTNRKRVDNVYQAQRMKYVETIEVTASGEVPDIMTSSDAMRFPIIASIALFSFYIAFKVFSKAHINITLTAYFLLLGVLALTHLITPLVDLIMPAGVPKIPYHLLFTQGAAARRQSIIDFRFTTYDIVCLVLSAAIGVWYLLQKHWIANNLFGLAFSINGIELLHLNNVLTGCILLSGLFVYDIFWVFGTDVMVTVARNFEAPIKLVFPQDLLTNGWSASHFAMLGLGDIVIPGIFIALLLRFDISLGRRGKLYFWATYGAYVFGLLFTMVILHLFKHAQPVLLYLVPLCLGTPLLLALIKGDLKRLFDYEDFSDAQKAGKKDKPAKKDKSGAKAADKTESAATEEAKEPAKKAKKSSRVKQQ